MVECLLIILDSFMEHLLYKLVISILLKLQSFFIMLFICIYGSTFSVDLHQLTNEDKISSRGNHLTASTLSITIGRLDLQLTLFTKIHCHDTDVPAFNNLAFTNWDLNGLITLI